MRMAVTFSHAAFVNPDITVHAMDAIVEGWSKGRASGNLNFAIWKDEIHTPLSELRQQYNIQVAEERQAA
jgi:ubiquinone biosynthesis protein Coq4